MSRIPLDNEWRALYREALMEPDPTQLNSRIEEANKAIQRRAMELWYVGVPETRERRELDTALHFLSLLATIGPEDPDDDEFNDDDKSAYDS